MPPAVAPALDAAPPKAEKPPRRPLTKKKLVALLLGVVLLALVIGGTAVVVLKKRAAAAAALAEAEGEPAAPHDSERGKTPPTYVPLEAFTVNLADKDAERFAQVGVTFELEDAHAVEQVKNYLPSIRNAILLLLAQQTSGELLGRAGKEALAQEIGRAATRAMGYDVPAAQPDATADAASASGGEPAIANKRPPRKPEPVGPIRRVHFANFIIQ
jgi:flagellar protein FliL